MKKASKFGALTLLVLTATLIAFVSSFEFNVSHGTAEESRLQLATKNKKTLHSTNMSLRSLAQKRGITIGTAVQTKSLQNDPTYRKVLAREFNILTPENAMKFKPLQPLRDRYNFANADAIVTFAQANQMQVYGHALVWHQSLPKWLTEGEWTREELMNIMRQHINTVVGRYRGKIVAWDVVNEAVSGKGGLRNTFWMRSIGPEYIEMAFRWAHAADPNAKLFYNDHDGEGLGRKSDDIYALVKDLRQRGVPIHGVGLQMHVSTKNPPNPKQVAANIKRLGDLGLEVRITEMDVRIHDGEGTTEQRLAAQADVYRDMLRVCLDAPNCKGFVTWGVADHQSWIPGYYGHPDAPLLFDKKYRPKLAYDAVLEELK